MPNKSSYSITAMRVFVDSGPTSAYTTSTGSLNTMLAMSTGLHTILARAWSSDGSVYEKTVSVTVNSTSVGSSGTSANSGTANPQPTTYSCSGTLDPPTADTCGQTQAAATNIGAVTCGSSITVTGNTLPAGSSDWLVFQVTTPRANCATLIITASIASPAAGQSGFGFDVVRSGGSEYVPVSYGPCGGGFAQSCVGGVGLGTETSPLQPGSYYVRIHGTSSSPSTWTLNIRG